MILKEQNNLVEIESLAHRACRLYQQQGSPEAGASALDKAAKIIEHTHPEMALNLYQHAVEVVMVRILFIFFVGIFNFLFNCFRLKINPVKVLSMHANYPESWFALECKARIDYFKLKKCLCDVT